jgi:serine phosphatase RsbU (regulator of sigma subunit)
VNRELGVVSGWVRTGVIDRIDAESVDDLLGSFLREHPWATSCIVADAAGYEHMLTRDGESWRARNVLDPGAGRVRWSTWSRADPRRVYREETIGYDPRVRPWYTGALERPGEIHWTRPYNFFTSNDPGITASVAAHTPDGELRVIAIDMLLIDISRFTSHVQVGGDGVAFVLDDDGRIVGMPRGPAFPDDEAMERALLERPMELDAPAARDLSAALLDGPSPAATDGGQRFVSQGEALWGQLRRFDLAPGRHLLIGVAVPESALVGDVKAQRIRIGLLTVAALALAVLQAAFLARRYSRPVEALVRESERMSTGDLEAGEPIRTSVAEVHRLAAAHDAMRQGLRTLLRIEHDLKIARRIQQSTFPRRLPAVRGFDLAAWSEPADETGGDTYDVIGLRGASVSDAIVLTDGEAERAVLLLADATGHGIGPALSVLQVRAMLRIAVRMMHDLSSIATHLNEQLCADLPSGRFITCWLGLIDAGAGTLTAVSGGQGPLLYYRAADDTFEVRQGDTTPFGLFEHDRIEVPPPRRMEPGDVFAAISDGIFEAARGEEEFGAERVQQVIREHREAGAAEILTAIREAQERFTEGGPAGDDRTMVLVKRV